METINSHGGGGLLSNWQEVDGLLLNSGEDVSPFGSSDALTESVFNSVGWNDLVFAFQASFWEVIAHGNSRHGIFVDWGHFGITAVVEVANLHQSEFGFIFHVDSGGNNVAFASSDDVTFFKVQDLVFFELVFWNTDLESREDGSLDVSGKFGIFLVAEDLSRDQSLFSESSSEWQFELFDQFINVGQRSEFTSDWLIEWCGQFHSLNAQELNVLQLASKSHSSLSFHNQISLDFKSGIMFRDSVDSVQNIIFVSVNKSVIWSQSSALVGGFGKVGKVDCSSKCQRN